MKRLLLVAAAIGAAGCAYYNGLYNANHLASEARRAERQGRTGEARSLWSRAAIKAESVAVRYPSSKWHDDALLLWGRALARTDACSQAVKPLGAVADSSRDTTMRTDARLMLGRCRIFMREPDSAVIALDPVVAGNGPRAREARALRAQAHLGAGRLAEAAEDAAAAGSTAVFIQATALAKLGRVDDAAGLLEARVPGPFDEPAWTSALEALGAADPDRAARIAGQLAGRPGLSGGAQARLYLAAAERWLARHQPDAAVPLLERASAAAPDSSAGRVARVHLLIRRVRAMTDLDDLSPAVAELRSLTSAGGAPVQAAGSFLSVLPAAAEALEPGAAVRLFLAAESVRDSLRAPGLAAALFGHVAANVPESALAPKALVAQLALRRDQSDSLVAILRTRYPESVYTQALLGEGGERYRAVEDSLARVFAAAGRAGPARRENSRRVDNE